jgi:hypothetical protein
MIGKSAMRHRIFHVALLYSSGYRTREIRGSCGSVLIMIAYRDDVVKSGTCLHMLLFCAEGKNKLRQIAIIQKERYILEYRYTRQGSLYMHVPDALSGCDRF